MARQQPVTNLLTGVPTPAPAAILAARGTLSQTAAAALVGATRDGWAKWESGARALPLGTWALYLLATDQHPAFSVVAIRAQQR